MEDTISEKEQRRKKWKNKRREKPITGKGIKDPTYRKDRMKINPKYYECEEDNEAG